MNLTPKARTIAKTLDIVLDKEKSLSLTPQEKEDFNNFLVGYLCNEVSIEVLEKALSSVTTYINMRRRYR